VKTLIVTGASRGLGAAIATSAAKEGYNVIGLARSGGQGEGYEYVSCDVSEPEQVKCFFKGLREDKSLYGLINAAGIASMNLLAATPQESIRRIVDVNLSGTISCCAAASKLLMRQKFGRIINFSTIAVPLGLKGEAVYVASKAGVEGFSRSFAREMGEFGTTVNVIAPGPIQTDLIAKIPAAKILELVESQIITEQAIPGDIWNIVSLLLDERANMITGQVINVGGA